MARPEAEHRLAVYGSLAPGEVNAHVLDGIRGAWREGTVRGDLQPEGWGMTHGFPALRWRPDGPLVPVRLLESPDLPAHWPRLDAFEGRDYRRIVVPVTTGQDEVPANIYVAAT
jgi:gamma-glutamylcyclotransferase (GGCT)/AIG2-like uncharacterized protein YtfP